MKRIKKIKWIPILTIILLFSCSGENEFESTNPSQENFVSLSLARGVAKNIPLALKGAFSKKEASSVLTVESIYESKNDQGKTCFYVINYIEGGFAIISADKRTQPILAFSENNKFIINESSFSPGLKFWINDTEKQITKIQNSNIRQSEKEKIAWKKIMASGIIKTSHTPANEPPTECYEHTEVFTIGPFLNSHWYQSGGFNDALPFLSCNGSNFQVYAGCVPIAMGQVMRYYEYPNNYNWSAMPLTSFGATTTTANFIADIHTAISNAYNGQPVYDCNGTGVLSSANMGNVLKTKFNYTSADKGNYNRFIVKSNITKHRPVILSGNNGSEGHMWICDGYQETILHFEDCTATGYLHFHMNWGWGGDNDGWYSFDNFNPNSTQYNNNKKMIYNIIP